MGENAHNAVPPRTPSDSPPDSPVFDGTYEYMAPEALYDANEYEEDPVQMQEDLMQIFRANVASGAVVVVDQDVAVHGWPGESPEIQSRRSLARSGSIDRISAAASRVIKKVAAAVNTSIDGDDTYVSLAEFNDTDTAQDAKITSQPRETPRGIKVGERVSAKYGRHGYEIGSVKCVNSDGTYAIKFDDGRYCGKVRDVRVSGESRKNSGVPDGTKRAQSNAADMSWRSNPLSGEWFVPPDNFQHKGDDAHRKASSRLENGALSPDVSTKSSRSQEATKASDSLVRSGAEQKEEPVQSLDEVKLHDAVGRGARAVSFSASTKTLSKSAGGQGTARLHGYDQEHDSAVSCSCFSFKRR